MSLGENVWKEGVKKGEEWNLDQTVFIYNWFQLQNFLFLVCSEKEPESVKLQGLRNQNKGKKKSKERWINEGKDTGLQVSICLCKCDSAMEWMWSVVQFKLIT